jgi:uncharacterized protein YodC (DUF2158 family)
MSDAKDGGPAFPFPEISHGGMSLRDWFAGQVIAGMFAGRATGAGNSRKEWAEGAYRMADAMLAARTTKKEETP